MKSVLAYVGIGSNMDIPHRQVLSAFGELAELPRSRISTRSSLYRTSPRGFSNQPDFVNAVAGLETALEPAVLLARLLEIERRHGRLRSFPNAPRTLDLDLLLYGDQTLRTAYLDVPHPRMHERAFVLIPLTELEPDLTIPGRGQARILLQECTDQRVRRLASRDLSV